MGCWGWRGGVLLFLRNCFLFCSLLGPTLPPCSSVPWLQSIFLLSTAHVCYFTWAVPRSPHCPRQLIEASIPWAVLVPSSLLLTWLLCVPSTGSLSDYSYFYMFLWPSWPFCYLFLFQQPQVTFSAHWPGSDRHVLGPKIDQVNISSLQKVTTPPCLPSHR